MDAQHLRLPWCEVVGRTDRGRRRPENQDSFCLEALDGARVVAAVADGMGGHRGGRTASRLAIEGLLEVSRGSEDGGDTALEEAVRGANARILAAAERDASLSGMGTTLTAALLTPEQAVVAHVGDSRLYQIRQGKVRRLTEDDSLVADLVRAGRLADGQADRHPLRHVLTQAVGSQPAIHPHLYHLPLQPSDLLLICSDGLTSHLEEDELVERLADDPDLERAAEGLIQVANQRGGADNITVVLVRLHAGETA